MGFSTQSEVLLVELEPNYDTDPTPTDSANAVEVFEPSWAFEGLSMIQRRPINNSIDAEQDIYAGSLRKISGKIEIKGSGAAGTTPRWSPILSACGFDHVNTPGTSDVYTTAEPTHDSCTCYFFEGGKRYILTGCRGSGRFMAETRDRLMFEFELYGHSVEPTDVAVSTLTPVFDSTTPPPFVGLSSLAIGSFSTGLEINKLDIDLGNKVTMPSSVRADSGYGEIIIPERDIQGSFDPEAVNKATNDFENELRAGTTNNLTTGTYGSAGNQVLLQANNCYYRNMTPGDRDSVRTYDIPFGIAGTVVLTIT